MQDESSAKISEWGPWKLFSPCLHLQIRKIRPGKYKKIVLQVPTYLVWLQDPCLSSMQKVNQGN